MKKKKLNKKLNLNKEIISNLQSFKGGKWETRYLICVTGLEPSYNTQCNECPPPNSDEPGLVCMPTVGGFCE